MTQPATEPQTTNAVPAPPKSEPKPVEPPKAALARIPEQVTEGGAISTFASASNFATAQRMAAALAASTMMPGPYQGNIPNCLIAIELASRIGASVFAVAQNIDIIHGRPSWRATFLIATVNASGKFTPIRYRWQGKEGTDSWGCRAVAKDRETGEECLGALITIALAKSEGWTKKSGSKWLTMPEQMLMYRAAAFWSRVYSPELSLGMQTREEVIDVVGTPVPDYDPPAFAQSSPKALEAALLGAPSPTVHVDGDGVVTESKGEEFERVADAARADAQEPKRKAKAPPPAPPPEDGSDDAGAEEYFAGRQPGED